MNRPHNACLVCLLATFVLGGCTRLHEMRMSLPWHHHAMVVKELPPVPPNKPMPVDLALQARARKELDAALKSSDPVIRAHALETVKQVNPPDAGSIVLEAINDPDPLVKKAAAMAAGELRIYDALDSLRNGYEEAAPPQRVAIVYAMHRMGDTTNSHDLEKTAVDPDQHIRGDTAVVLGMIGEKSAVPILLRMLRNDREPDVRLQAAEALWKLGDARGEEELIDATISAYPDDRILAALGLAQPRDVRVMGHIQPALTDDFDEVALVAARAIGMLGSDQGYGVALQGAKAPDPRQRALAALAMEDIGRLDAQPVLGNLLDDTDADVRLAAAGAIMQIDKKG